jgi:hypothetical protein
VVLFACFNSLKMSDESQMDSEMESEYDSELEYDVDSDLELAMKMDDFESAMEHIKTHHISYYVEHMKELSKYFGTKFHRDVVQYSMDQFTKPKIYDEILKTRTIILAGPSGYGKTCYAMAHFKNPVVICNKADYAKINNDTDGIIYEMDMYDLSVSEVKNITDLSINSFQEFGQNERVLLKAGLPRFICVTLEDNFWPTTLFSDRGLVKQSSEDDYNSIRRRVAVVEVFKPLFDKTVNAIEQDYKLSNSSAGVSKTNGLILLV